MEKVTWKQVASTRAKREMESQAVSPEGEGRLREAANAIRRKPAGMRRKEETKKGPYFGMTSFMATMAVPQKKKGDTNTAHSHTAPSATELSSGRATVSSKLDVDEEGETTPSKSCPVPRQSKSTASCSFSFSSNSMFVPPVHLTIFFESASKPVKIIPFLKTLLLLYGN